MNKKNVVVIGAGQLGSRHLQALKKVKYPLNISVVDTFENSLKIAKERYDTMDGDDINTITYGQEIDISSDRIDAAIIATNSDARAGAVAKLLNKYSVNTMILEKILFNNEKDYNDIAVLIEEKDAKAYINCSMRAMKYYFDMKSRLEGDRNFTYKVTGSNFGLITNAIHYIDHIAFLCESDDFVVDTSGLEIKPIESKRRGFLEFNGTLRVKFDCGASGEFVCYSRSNAPVVVEVFGEKFRCISKESEGKAWISDEKNNWVWNNEDVKIPYQSEMTKELIEKILNGEECTLVQYKESAKIHKQFLNALRQHLTVNCNIKTENYPFT